MAKRFGVCAHWVSSHGTEGHMVQRRVTANVKCHVTPSYDKHCTQRRVVFAFRSGRFGEERRGNVCRKWRPASATIVEATKHEVLHILRVCL